MRMSSLFDATLVLEARACAAAAQTPPSHQQGVQAAHCTTITSSPRGLGDPTSFQRSPMLPKHTCSCPSRLRQQRQQHFEHWGGVHHGVRHNCCANGADEAKIELRVVGEERGRVRMESGFGRGRRRRLCCRRTEREDTSRNVCASRVVADRCLVPRPPLAAAPTAGPAAPRLPR